jgi:phosphate transport system substrate-binding protein
VIQYKGSDTLVNVAQAWAEHYKDKDPSVAIAVTGGGSGTGIAAMINGTVDIASSSREMKDSELEMAHKNGVDPKKFIVGYDALAVFLHPANPIDSMTVSQLAEIYGEDGAIESWDQMGIRIPGCDSNEIVRVSRQNNSGTYHYFREVVVGKKHDFKPGSMDMNGSKDVVELVSRTPTAIGYSGLGYATPEVRVIPVAPKKGDPAVTPSIATVLDKSYPIARPMFMYTPGEPAPHVKKYLDWIHSDAGQAVVEHSGYVPLTKK